LSATSDVIKPAFAVPRMPSVPKYLRTAETPPFLHLIQECPAGQEPGPSIMPSGAVDKISNNVSKNFTRSGPRRILLL
jgi:hypothetical protein